MYLLLIAYSNDSLRSSTIVFNPYVELPRNDDGDDHDNDPAADDNSTIQSTSIS